MWPSENPWPAITICLMGTIILLILWSQKRRVWLLAGVVLTLLLAVGAWSYDRAVITEREKIHSNVLGIVRAFEERDLDRTTDFISNSSPDLKQMAGWAYNYVELGDDTRITDIQVEFIPHTQRAKSRFRVNGTLTSRAGSQRISTLWEAKWQSEDGQWKMIDILKFDPVNGQQEELPNDWRRFIQSKTPG